MLSDDVPIDSEEAIKRLGENGIGSRPFFYPMHLQPVLINNGFFKGEKYPVAEKLSGRGFYIPSGLSLNINQQKIVAESIKEIITR